MGWSEASTVLNQANQNLINMYQAKNAKEYADKNFDLQSENFDYQKALQERIFAREDTALQRYVNDLEAAGLNKQLAAGSSGSGAGSVVSTTAPQYNASWLDKLKLNLDFASSLEQIRQQKIATETMNQELSKRKLEKQMLRDNASLLQDTYQDQVSASHYLAKVRNYDLMQMARTNDLNTALFNYYRGSPSDGVYENYLKPYEFQMKLLEASSQLKGKEQEAFWIKLIGSMLSSAAGAVGRFF